MIKGIASSYQAVYSLVIGELKSKLKISRPRSISQKSTAINEFKNNLHQQIKALLDKALPQINKYKKVIFWCSDERSARTAYNSSAPADAFRRKARREASMEIRVFLAVWGRIERYGKKFFLGVFAFRQSLF